MTILLRIGIVRRICTSNRVCAIDNICVVNRIIAIKKLLTYNRASNIENAIYLSGYSVGCIVLVTVCRFIVHLSPTMTSILLSLQIADPMFFHVGE